MARDHNARDNLDPMTKHPKEADRLRKIVDAFPKITVTKTRILAGMTHTARQQVVRVDREPQVPPNQHLTRELYLAAREYIHASDALLVSDYGYGAATPAIVNTLRKKGKLRTVSL